MLGHVWARLVADGLLKDVLAAAVGLVVTHAYAWRPLKAHRRRQEKIIDLLDTGTPGGLGDLMPGGKRTQAGEGQHDG